MTHKNLDANKTNSDAFTLASYTCTTGIRSDGVGLQGGTIRGTTGGATGGTHQHAHKVQTMPIFSRLLPVGRKCF